MKKLLILFLATGFLAACNGNNNLLGGKDRTADKNDKEEKSDVDKKNSDGYDDEDSKTTSKWSKKDRDKAMDKCMENYSDEPKAKQICACFLDKMQTRFSSFNEAMNASEDETDDIIEKCEGQGGNTNDYDNRDDYSTTDRKDDYKKDDSDETNNDEWTDLQRQTFIKGCASTAKQSGLTTQQANSYCECMTKKVERKYSFDKANKLSAADFQTAEWQQAIRNCQGY